MKNLFKVNIFTYLLFVLSIFSGYFRELLIVFIVLVIHEFGHIIIMKMYNISILRIELYPYGCMVKSDILININSKRGIFISMGGILIQLLLILISFFLFNIKIIDHYYYKLLFDTNKYIILFNLLPVYPLDGYKILNYILEMFFPFRKSVFISIIISVITLILFIVYLYFFKINNYVIISFLIISLFEYINTIKYYFNKFYLERVIYNINYKGLVSVKNKKCMYKNKKNYINGIDEKRALMFDIT